MRISKTAYYSNERIYEKTTRNYNQKIIDYWEKIVGRDYIEQSCKTEKFVKYFRDIGYEKICLDKQWSTLEKIFLKKVQYIQPYKDEGKFDSFFEVLVIVAKSYFINECSDKFSLRIWELIDNQLLKQRFIKIAIRTLICEVENHRENKKLNGETPNEQYRNYITDYLCNTTYLLETYRMYPVLYREIFRCIIFYTDYVKEFSENLKKDFDIIRSKFEIQEDMKSLSKIVPLSSDFHKRNKFAFYLEFFSGKRVVYKPRCLNNEILFQKMEQIFFGLCGVNYIPVKIINYREYSWMEYLQNKECCTAREVEEYYRRYGVLIFLVYLLGTKDIHYENIIACGSVPRLIDLEVLMSLPREKCNSESANEIIQERLRKSVTSSGMLPLFAWDLNGQGVNVSALNGMGGQFLPIRVPRVKNIGRADIYIDYEYAKTPISSNFVKYAGKIMNPIQYINEIQQGFLMAYEVLKGNKSRIITVLRKEIDGILNRYLIRDTQQYEMILSLSYHPDFLKDAVKREYLLSYLLNRKNEKISRQILDSEIQALIRGDIPYFYVVGRDNQLFEGTGCAVKDFCGITKLKQVEQHIYSISDTDIEFQRTLIYQSMGECQSTDKEMILKEVDEKAYIEMIIQKIIKQAVYNKKYTDVSWITTMNIEYGNRKLVMNPMDDYLYSGKMGILIFLKAYLKSNINREVQKIVNILQRYFFQYTEENMNLKELKIRPTGIFVGEASIIYGYQVIYQMTGDVVYLDYAEKHTSYLLRILDYDTEYDLVGGNAGAILALVNMYEITKKKCYLKGAIQAFGCLKKHIRNYGADRAAISNTQLGRPLAGTAHGCAGYAYAFSKIAYYTQDYDIYELVEKFLNYEDTLYSPELHDWKDMRTDAQSTNLSASWCYGRMGIYYMWTETEKYCNGRLKSKIKEYLNKPQLFQAKTQIKETDCLCHGNMGIYEMETKRKKKASLNKKKEFFLYQMREVEEIGFMIGKSGVGYWLEKRNTALPNILLLRI